MNPVRLAPAAGIPSRFGDPAAGRAGPARRVRGVTTLDKAYSGG